ncbi:hypothetical protein KDRO_E09680 [Kluyveromyces lactis]|nr:hypothetical protein KDRO_E09680 [Kluyveromyces lactis]
MATGDASESFQKYRYDPSKAAAVAVCAIFGVQFISMIIMIATSSRRFDKMSASNERKVRNFTILRFLPFLVGIAIEAVGYGMRYMSANDTDKLTPYILQSVFLLVAPALYAATIYMVFGQMLHYLQCTKLSIVPARWSTTIFVIGDVLSFFVQGAGAGIMANADTSSGSKTGSNIIVVGLFVQVAVFSFFMITELRFLYRVKRTSAIVQYLSLHWRTLNLTLLGISLLILIRSLVRAIEFIQGNKGFIISHEYFLYVFDALMMILATLVWIVTFKFGDIFKIIYEVKVLDSFKENSGDDASYMQAEAFDKK